MRSKIITTTIAMPVPTPPQPVTPGPPAPNAILNPPFIVCTAYAYFYYFVPYTTIYGYLIMNCTHIFKETKSPLSLSLKDNGLSVSDYLPFIRLVLR